MKFPKNFKFGVADADLQVIGEKILSNLRILNLQCGHIFPKVQIKFIKTKPH